jgi:hypothetical protein
MEGGIQGERFEEIPSSQFKNDNTMQLIMKKLYEQRLNKRPLGICFLTWTLFSVNDESPIAIKVPQVMHYILCYNKLIGYVILE